MRDISKKNMNSIEIVQLNINSIRNKFDLIVFDVIRNLDILLRTKISIDNCLPENHFKTDGFTTP